MPEALHGLLDCAMLASRRRAFDPMEAAVSQVGPLLLVDVGLRFLGMARACSVVLEAEAQEPDAMSAPPRRPDQTLSHRSVVVRGVWQGA